MSGNSMLAGGQVREGAAVWRWTVRHRVDGLHDDFVVRTVSWDGDGTCLALTDNGLWAWNGTEWLQVSTTSLPDPDGVRFVERFAPGRWLVGGDLATLATYSAAGVTEVRSGPDPSASYRFASGDLDDLCLIAGEVPGDGVVLYASCGQRWLKPLPLTELSFVTGLSRVGEDEWLVVGRLRERGAAAFRVRPLMFEAERLPTPKLRGLFASAGSPERKAGLAVGCEGTALWWNGSELAAESVRGADELALCAVDAHGRGWSASGGDIWLREAQGRWSKVRQDSRAANQVAPVVGIFAESATVTALTADGGIIEGRRAPSQKVVAPPRPQRKSVIPRPDPRPSPVDLTPELAPVVVTLEPPPVALVAEPRTVDLIRSPAPVESTLEPPPVESTPEPPPVESTLEPPPVELVAKPATVELIRSPARAEPAATSTPINLTTKRRHAQSASAPVALASESVIDLTKRKLGSDHAR